MKRPKSSFTNHPFREIKSLLKAKAVSFPDLHSQAGKDDDLEKQLFDEAMEGVTPILRDQCIERIFRRKLPDDFRDRDAFEVLSKLKELVEKGTGFNISDTPEYIEGTGYHIHPEIARRLHRGDYSIQAHVDLHGLGAEVAEEVFNRFLKWAVMAGKRGVLIIHGRGLSSPSEPVLKRKVVDWLTRGPWRKWVIAYSSARRCDGGAGATYLLLRDRPVSKKRKIRKTT